MQVIIMIITMIHKFDRRQYEKSIYIYYKVVPIVNMPSLVLGGITHNNRYTCYYEAYHD